MKRNTELGSRSRYAMGAVVAIGASLVPAMAWAQSGNTPSSGPVDVSPLTNAIQSQFNSGLSAAWPMLAGIMAAVIIPGVIITIFRSFTK